ncbi:piezo-type mechanosensitive ion channel component isoform X13 [Culex pipiens pallens]|uniref:piezo-type mechanosensitive ion channel component isoform X13 n=1 Tax=Culex pipiens pallens TaxID=42434 RepID=UPI0019531E3C|nr:piezo-type mechanosensitive ion channel component isoform X13 [Culex pipiens pallens]
MANYFICLVVQRLILPLILAICCLLRPVGLSLPYLIFLLALPFVPVATPRSIKGSTGIYFKIYIAVSILLLLGQIAFQIVFVVLGYELIEQCQFTEILLRHVGLVKFEDLNASMVVYWIAPEIIMTLTSGIVYGVLKKLANGAIGEEVGPGTATSPTSLEAPEVLSLGCGVGGPNPVSREKLAFLTKLGVVLSVAMLCLAAVLQPSVPSGIYFVIFLGSATWWACYKELDRAFGVVLRITLVFLVVHITGFLAYQNPWPQELLPANGTLARIFSLTPILSSSCDNLTDIRNVNFESDLGSDYYLNPVVLLLCYYCISITSSLLLRPRLTEKELKRQELFYQLESGVRLHRQISFRMNRKNILRKTLTSDRWRGAARKVKLMRGGTRRVRDASSSDAQPSIQNDTIAMHTIGRKPISEEDDSTSFFEQIMLATGNVASFIYKNSYIFTNVIMMTWSIMYHSWLTFVLLIWANLIWIMPNQRKNMLNSSPFLVIYAELLLLAQYLYGMKLTDDELPSTVNITGINLAQIGFIKYRDYPSSPLLIKSLFTTMFWISLRQMIQEKQMERRTSAIADLAAPLQVTVGAATTGTAAGRPLEKKSSAFITRAGTLINSFLIKFWIWVVAITLFLSGMTGTRMTGFRIVYMALFLIFVLTFQFSFKVWRKMMYAFWLTVIVYSMAILVLVYTYQFDKFPLYWKEYLKISDTLQKDIGLQIYETKQLFLHLVNPTMIVIITVIQLHYCHKKFLEISEIPVIQDNEIPAISETSSAYGTFSKRKKMSNTTEAPPIEKDPESDHGDEAPTGKVKLPPTDDKDDDDNTSEILDDLRFRKLSKQEIKGVAQKLVNRVMQLTELVWLFAEIHLLKIILIVAFSLGVETVSFLHLLYVFMTVFAVKSHTNSLVLITRIMSLISSILLITTMMYQVEYIKEANFVSECPNIAANSTDMDMNNAKWFGFQKTDALSSLADLLRPYLIYIIVVTIHAVVVLRQTIRRIRLGQSPRTPHLMFPNVTRSDADKDIPRMIKYLFNYGFYKFGVEISLVSLISLIAYRMDVFSCLYAVWVCVMFHMTRDSLRKMWRFLTWFTVSLIPLQYVIFIGLPPALCVDYPWDIPFLDHFRIWAMLPENTEQFRSKAPKMVSDFLLLMFLCRQTLVFRIEARYNSCPDDFGGGSNKSVLDDIDKLGTVPFINPTPDFIAKVRNWLDISKRGIFLVFFWCTLAIVFLTGSSRVTLFSIGYLIGSFTFLWQGTDFYLRPIRAILKTWNMLIAYNVFVITTKTLLQMIGCLYLTTLTEKNCWLVQLLGVSCLSNPPVEEASTDPLVLAPTCKVPYSDSGLFWDGFCFAFLLVQRRIFSSHYFCHIINETKASTILASRGAELIEDLRIKDVKKEAERESQILQKIKMKMDRIKATQQKILEPVHDPTTHAKDPRRRPSLWRRISENRSAAIRSGDYYMFEDTEHEFELDLMQPRDSDEEFEKKGSAERRLSRRHLTLGKLYAKIKEHSEQEAAALHLAEGESSLTAAADPAEGTSTAGPVRHSSSPALGRRDSEKTTAGPPDHRTGTISEPIPRHTHFDVGSGKRKSDDDDEPDGQKPSTSKGTPRHQSSTDEEARLISDDDEEGDEEIDVEEATKGKAGKRSKFSFSGLTLVTAFLAGALGSLTLRLHRVSRSYRYVMKVLAKEKKILKETPGFGAGMRTGTSMIWTPIQGSLRSGSAHSGASSSSVKSRAGTPIPGRLALSRSSVHNSNSSLPRLAPASDQTQQQQPEQSPIQPQAPPTTPTQQQSPQEQQQPSSSPSPSSPKVSQCDHEQTPTSVVAHHHGGEPELPDEGRLHQVSGLGAALAMMARKEHQGKEDKSTELIEGDKSPKDDVSEEDFASQEHSVIVEFLQAAWYAILSHTDFICYFLVFLNQVKSASLLSLPLPLMVTLWGTLTFPRPSKNFWVTLIAYTQTIVILKCVCQFDMLWWNQREIAPNQPFAPARIIGIEHKEGYATYDLALLLVLFCHRFILKSLGLWKSDFVDESEVSEGFYKLDTTDEKTKALIKAAQEVEKELFRFDFLTRLGDVLESSLIDMNDSDEHEFPQTSPGDVRRQRRERMIRFLGSRSDSLHVPLAYKLPLNHRYAAAKVLKTVDLEGRESLVIRQETTELSMVKVEEGTEQQQLDQQEPNGNGALVCVTHHAEEAGDYFPQIVKHSCLKYTDSVKAFFNQLLDRQSRKTADVYGYLFLCDFINFFVILFGFSAFGTQEGDGGVLSYFEENKVPMTFLLMLIIQFFLIVVDRALYLRKYMVGKILFQFFLIIGIHIWMFFVLPATTERSFNATNPPVYYYLIKCFYLLFSAYQIRCGYPARILGNFVTKGFTMINFTGFKLFMTIPFLFELRTLMDWIWTDTSMTLFDWLKMEDIFSNVYQLKCMRQLEEDLPAPRGQKKGSLVKYLMGGGMMLGIILLIWFPLALFAFSNAVGEPNLPYDVSVTLRIGPYEPVYVMSAQDSNIHGLNEDQWEQLLNNYSKSKTALTFLSNYESVDVAAVKLGANSTSIWNISPPDKERLLNDLNGTVTLTCRFRYTISRKSHSKENPGTVSEEKPYELRGDDPVRPALVQMLATDSNISVTLPYLMPKFLKVKNSGNVKPIHQLMDKVDSDDSFRNYRNITLRLFQTHQNNSVPLFWWEVKENCTDNSFVNMPYADCLSHLVMYMFNDKIFPSTISSIAAGGIIGIYSTLILVFSRMLRTSIFSGASSKIMFEDLPYVDRVLQLCLDIYLVRESLEFTLEEDLFAKLIFLYRSPETMIKWTRPKNEDGDDESDSMSTSSKSRKKND